MNGAANGHGHGQAMQAIFPEALKSLAEVDPEVTAIIEDEKRRQWCARQSGLFCRRMALSHCVCSIAELHGC